MSLSGVCEDNDAEDDDHDHDIGDGDQDDIELDLAEQPWVAHELEGKCQQTQDTALRTFFKSRKLLPLPWFACFQLLNLKIHCTAFLDALASLDFKL